MTLIKEPIQVPSSSLSPVIMTMLRYGLTAVGGYFVAKGMVDEAVVNEIIGALMILIPAVAGAVLTNKDQNEKVIMAERLPNSVAEVK